MDLTGLRRDDLRNLCEFLRLTTSGTLGELRLRVREALCEGAPVTVYWRSVEGYRDGYISGFLKGRSGFEVTFTDGRKRLAKTKEVLLSDFDFQLGSADGYEAADGSSGGWKTDNSAGSDAEGDSIPPEEMSKEELRAALRERGLSGSGTKEQLIERLQDALAQEEESDDEESIALEEMSKEELRAALRERGLSGSGTKEQLIERLQDALEQEEESDDEESIALEEMSKEELRAALRERGLSGSGTKEQLIERLQDALEQEEESDDEEDHDTEDDVEEHAGSNGVDDITAGMAGLNTWDSSSSNPAGGCSGHGRRALIIGASLPGREGHLPGVIPDTKSMHQLLIKHFGFPKGCFKVLTDDHSDRLRLSTYHNIRRGCEWLTRGVKRGDSLFFYFSGHGASMDDPSEPRGTSQCICPSDHDKEGFIYDKQLFDWLVKDLPQGVTLHALIDSCHSGTVMNLPYNAVMEGGSFVDWEDEYPDEDWRRTSAGQVVQFSASRDDQSAYETEGRRGAATYAFVQAIRRHKKEWGFNIEYGELLQAMYEELQNSEEYYGQEPTMSASHKINPLSSTTKFEL